MQFDDGYVKVLRGTKLSKVQPKSQVAPLFDPVTGTKQDRRDRKRKINIAALFGKRPRHSTPHQEEKNNSSDASMLSPSEDIEPWFPSYVLNLWWFVRSSSLFAGGKMVNQ